MGENPDVVQEQYRMRFSRFQEYRNKVWRILCDRYFAKLVPADARVLDLGCGWGEFINNIRAAKKYAMDFNPDAQLYLSRETHFLHQDCCQPWQLAAESLDVVFTSNFLEHLADKSRIQRVITEAHRCLREGGLIVCLGPNIRYVAGAYWDFWDHFVPLTERSLAELLELEGFTIQSSIPRFLPYSMSTGRCPPLFLLELYLKLPRLWRFFGKQFLVVGRKRSARSGRRTLEVGAAADICAMSG